MKAHSIFQGMSPALVAEIFTWLQNDEKPVYKAALQGLANQRKLRPVFIERKPPAERHPWLQQALGRNVSEALASHLLQAWLLGPKKQMLNDFLSALEIPHNDDGTVDDLPGAPPKEKLAQAVDQLLEKYPYEHVAVYLHAFQDMDANVSWEPLRELLSQRPELQLPRQATRDHSGREMPQGVVDAGA